MAETLILKAEPRGKTGKSASRAARIEGRVPAVIYGDKDEPQAISINFGELQRHVNSGTFLSTLFMVEIDGEQTRTIPRDVQYDPVRDFPIHVDFLRLGAGATINVDVPVNFVNEEAAPGLKAGGVLNVVRHTIELLCPADAIPEAIEIDLSGLEIGASVHISEITLPEGAKPTITDRDFTVATIAAPTIVEVDDEETGEDDEELEGAEGEEGAAGEGGEDAGEEGGND